MKTLDVQIHCNSGYLNKCYKVNVEEHFVSIVDGCFIRGLSSPE